MSEVGVDPALARVREDFDRIALIAPDGWDHSARYHRDLLRHAPSHCAAALDVGCGTGAFSRLLAERSDRVLALDLAANMIRVARARSLASTNIEYQTADVMARDLPPAHFDCIAAIATLHHLPFGPALRRLREALKPGGTLLVLDLFRPQTAGDWIAWSLSVPLAVVLRWAHSGLRPPSPEVRAAWEQHGRSDRYAALREARGIAALLLPGARVRRHLLWRYSIVWRKPDGPAG